MPPSSPHRFNFVWVGLTIVVAIVATVVSIIVINTNHPDNRSATFSSTAPTYPGISVDHTLVVPTFLPTAPFEYTTAHPLFNSPWTIQELSAAGQLDNETAQCHIKGKITLATPLQYIYYIPGGKLYKATVINPDYGERWFCTEQDAIANGWRKSEQ